MVVIQPRPPTHPSAASTTRRPGLALLAAMLLSVLLVGALAYWDSSRESAAALEDFAQEQVTLATSVAAELGTRLALASTHDGAGGAGLRLSPQQLLAGLARVGRAGESELLVRAPGTETFLSPNGGELRSAKLLRALEADQRTVRLERPEAVAVGLPERMAIAGLANLDAGSLGHWGIAVVATASRQRDRERRAAARLVLAVLLAAALVGAFGGLAMRVQRHELRLQQDLALAELSRQRDERLERLDKAATMLTMASGVAHELSTPLSVIAGRAELLLERAGTDDKLRRALQSILDQAQSINAVVRGFLELARGGTPTLQLVSPATVAASALALVQHRFEAAGVQLSRDVPPELPSIACEPRLLEHALVNLLLNACDACARGGRVELTAELAQGQLRLSVVDDGAGISPGDAARVTEPFFTTKPAGKGTGLGLAIVSEIAKSHHGALSLAPAAPRGTRASMQLPLASPRLGS